MAIQLVNMLASIAAIVVGGLIGAGFGMVQDAARRRNEKQQQQGELKSGWSLVPGSGARVAYLLVVLALIQIFCPLLFTENTKWWVSGGVTIGYGLMLYLQLRRRLTENK